YEPAAAAPIARELAEVLWTARNTLGRWHFGAAGVALTRALSVLPASAPEAQPFTVTVQPNGKEILRDRADPADPFGSAAALAWVDLSAHLHVGENHLVVTTLGTSAPWVELTREVSLTVTAESPLTRVVGAKALTLGAETTVRIHLPRPDGKAAV